MKRLTKLTRLFGSDARKRKLAESLLTSIEPLPEAKHLLSLPTASLEEMLDILKSHGFPPLGPESSPQPKSAATKHSHTLKAEILSRACTERRTRAGLPSEWLYITRLGPNAWTYYIDRQQGYSPFTKPPTSQ